MNERQCPSCGGFCKKSGCERENIKPLGQKRHDLQMLVRDIKAVVHERDGAISVTEAIGALEIAKMEIYESQK